MKLNLAGINHSFLALNFILSLSIIIGNFKVFNVLKNEINYKIKN